MASIRMQNHMVKDFTYGKMEQNIEVNSKMELGMETGSGLNGL